MKYWIGVICFALAAWLVYSAVARRRRKLAEQRERVASGEADSASLHPSLSVLRDVVPPLMILWLAAVGLSMTSIYVIIDGWRYMPPFDLIGFLALLIGFGTWFYLRYLPNEEPAAGSSGGGGSPGEVPSDRQD